jgi:hypothetical protein
MRLGWIRPDRWRRIDAVIDYFGDRRDARPTGTRGAADANRVRVARGRHAATSRPHTMALLRTALLVHGARS